MSKPDITTTSLEVSEGKHVVHTRTLSVFLKLKGTQGTVVGEDLLAENWARFAASREATVKFYHPKPSEQFLKERDDLNQLEWLAGAPTDIDLSSCDWLVVCLSDFRRCESLAKLASSHRLACAFLHFPELGTFIVPRVYGLDSLQVLLPLSSTDPPMEPAYSDGLHGLLPSDYSQALQLLQSIERKLVAQFKDVKHRAAIFDSLLNSHFSRLIYEGRWGAAETLADKVLDSYRENPERRQRVSPRIKLELIVYFQVNRQLRVGKLFNLSRDGVFIATRETVPKLTHITHIDFTLPTGASVSHAEGFVVWENSPFRPVAPIYPPGFAIMFDSMTDQNLQAIEQYVQSQLEE